MITYITVDSTITGVGKYAYDVYNLLQPESEIIQIIFNRKFMDKYRMWNISWFIYYNYPI